MDLFSVSLHSFFRWGPESPHPGTTKPASLRSSRLSSCCQLLSRQCRSCVAISSYIWLLGLWQFCLLPSQACSFLFLLAKWHIPVPALAAMSGGLHPVTPQTGCSLCHNSTRAPCQGFFVLFFFSSLLPPLSFFFKYSLILPSLLGLCEILLIWNVLGCKY